VTADVPQTGGSDSRIPSTSAATDSGSISPRTVASTCSTKPCSSGRFGVFTVKVRAAARSLRATAATSAEASRQTSATSSSVVPGAAISALIRSTKASASALPITWSIARLLNPHSEINSAGTCPSALSIAALKATRSPCRCARSSSAAKARISRNVSALSVTADPRPHRWLLVILSVPVPVPARLGNRLNAALAREMDSHWDANRLDVAA
jgi:hypothetical protein